MTDPLDPMLPVEPGSDADRILRGRTFGETPLTRQMISDHEAMNALRRHPQIFTHSERDGQPNYGRRRAAWYHSGGITGFTRDDPADAILAAAAAIEDELRGRSDDMTFPE